MLKQAKKCIFWFTIKKILPDTRTVKFDNNQRPSFDTQIQNAYNLKVIYSNGNGKQRHPGERNEKRNQIKKVEAYIHV